MRAGRRTIAFLLVMLCGAQADATNPGFLPGDCCFLTSLTQEGVKTLQDSDSPTFGYEAPDPLSMKFCGYSGYWTLQVVGMPLQQRAALKSAYESVREFQPRELTEFKDSETGKLEVVETNPVRVLIVNRDFDFDMYGVLGKYNESWPTESLAFSFGGKPVPDRTYVPIVQNVDVVIKEWYHGAEVAPLTVELPVPLESTVGPRALQPVKATKPLRFIVLPEPFESYVKPEDGTGLYVVDDELTEYRYAPVEGWLTAAEWKKLQDDVEEAGPEDAKQKPPTGGW